MKHDTRTCDIPVPHFTDLPGSVPVRRCGKPGFTIKTGDPKPVNIVIWPGRDFDVCDEHAKLPLEQLVKLIKESGEL